MRTTAFIPFILIGCLALPACEYQSVAERALIELRDARQTIHRINADRDSAKDLAPIQQRICRTFCAFAEVTACECIIYPETTQTETENSDKSIGYGEATQLQIAVLITLKTQEIWAKGRAEREVAGLLRDNGFKDFTLLRAVQSDTTWIVRGWGPVQSPDTKKS